jgi:hypothetical protein
VKPETVPSKLPHGPANRRPRCSGTKLLCEVFDNPTSVPNGQRHVQELGSEHMDSNGQSCSFALPIPVTARSKAWVCGRSLAGIVGSNPAGDSCVCVLSSRGLCVGLIIRPEESYRVWCV